MERKIEKGAVINYVFFFFAINNYWQENWIKNSSMNRIDQIVHLGQNRS